ncbi:hypothetical protein [Clostridium oceanicum]|uniref:SbsA Ig-like domain-containing protein n=1 Tax=Clostridium oceanicum TaxID=1543 RepID=A0ABN1JD09_9CLOT
MNNNAIKIILAIIAAVIVCTISISAFLNINEISDNLRVLSIDRVQDSRVLGINNKYKSNEKKDYDDVVQDKGAQDDWIYCSTRDNKYNLNNIKRDYKEKQYSSSLYNDDINKKFSFIVTFNIRVKESFVNGKNIFILDSSGKKINTKLSIEKNNKKIKITPLEYYERDKEYYLYIISSNIDKKNTNPMNNIKIDLNMEFW